MLKFYFNGAPNPLKVALFLEEAGLEYEGIPVDTKLGDQHAGEFRRINPNGKVPALQDGASTLFDSSAILLYLAEKTGKFIPQAKDDRGSLLSWLMFLASGVGPYSGQCVHFRHFAPEDLAYPKKRYDFEARRHWQIIDDRLAKGEFMLGDSYSIVDMSVWGWATRIPFMLGGAAMDDWPNLARLMSWIDARPATCRALKIGERHRFQQEFDEPAMRNLYPQIFVEE